MPKRRADRERLEGRSNEDLWAKWFDHAHELALDVLQRRLKPLLVAVTRYLLDGLDAAEDVLAVTWEKLLKIDKKPENFGAFASTVARNEAKSLKSKEDRRRGLEDTRQDELPGPKSPDEDLPWLNEPDRNDVIVEWLAGLSEYERGIVRARYWDDHTLKRIAADNGTNIAKINRDLKRLRADLKDLLERTELSDV